MTGPSLYFSIAPLQEDLLLLAFEFRHWPVSMHMAVCGQALAPLHLLESEVLIKAYAIRRRAALSLDGLDAWNAVCFIKLVVNKPLIM